MTARGGSDQSGGDALTARDLMVATLVGRYVERRERGEAPCAHDLLAVAAELGDTAVEELRAVLTFYEAMRSAEGVAR